MDKEKNAPDLMRYDLRIQEALRGAVRSIMNDIARTGFPGDHHFYVSFRTRARGVQMSERLRKQYPDEMTIVLQHQFWDLVVGEKEFSVGLSFKQVPEKLVIPFDAISSFVDPTVHFALKFEVATESETPEKPAAPAMIRPLAPVSLSGPGATTDKTEPLQDTAIAPRRAPAKPAAQEPAKNSDKDKPAEKQEKQKAAADGDNPSKEPGKIVSIDAFRKKT
jgi:hypothetical protein